MTTPVSNRGIIGIAVTLLTMACSQTAWDDLPPQIARFITTYYPGVAIDSYDDTGGCHHVQVKDGPTMEFDSDYQWTLIDGKGVPLPSIFFFDQLPKVYDYLVPREETDKVFIAENYPRSVILTFSDHIVEYIKSTGNFVPVINRNQPSEN